jgi:hypothetical protein
MIFEKPIIAVKHVKQPDSDTENDKKDYVLCHVSFQSTGETNISTVNALLLVDLYVQDCSKGRGQQKRTWGIEMNEAQETYLKNQILLGWDLSYRSWRWWHALTRHAKAIAMSMAYSLYLQCAEGTVNPEWKVTPVSGPRFWQRMSLQMVQYKSSNLHYPGNEKMCNHYLGEKKKARNKQTRLGNLFGIGGTSAITLILDFWTPEFSSEFFLIVKCVPANSEHVFSFRNRLPPSILQIS